jgi:hypothetical protein
MAGDSENLRTDEAFAGFSALERATQAMGSVTAGHCAVEAAGWQLIGEAD